MHPADVVYEGSRLETLQCSRAAKARRSIKDQDPRWNALPDVHVFMKLIQFIEWNFISSEYAVVHAHVSVEPLEMFFTSGLLPLIDGKLHR